MPLSVSIFRVCASCQEMRNRVGWRRSPAMPNASHCPSMAGVQALATLVPSAFRGRLATSPAGGVTMRQRQSSVMTATQFPVKSIVAMDCGVGGVVAPPPPCGACAATPLPNVAAATKRTAKL
jgi:hypothetical protein